MPTAKNVGTARGDFYLYRIDASNMPELFINAKDIKNRYIPSRRSTTRT